ncbi:MAG: PAS domain-containing protein [Spongiibacteraceae bacterium]
MPPKRDNNNGVNQKKTGAAESRALSSEMLGTGLNDDALRQILVTSGHAYTIWIPGDRNPYISESLATFLGYLPDSFSVSGIADLIRYVHKHDRQSLLSVLQKATYHGGNYECDFRILCANGDYRWFRIRGTSYEHDDKGTPTRVIGCISDIDELKKSQLQAEKEREKSEWLRNISTFLFESVAPDRMSTALNSFAQRLACTRTYLRLKNPVDGNLDIIAESYVDGLQPLQQIVAEKYPGSLQKNFIHLEAAQDVLLLSIGPDSTALEQQLSSDFGTRYSAVIPLTQNGQVQGELVLLSAEDPRWSDEDLQLAREFSQLTSLIFEREAIAAGLRESDERFHLAMQASRDGLWDTQIGLDRVYVSPSYFRMTGHDLPGGIYPREITGVYIHPEDLLMVREKLSQFIRSKKENDSIEFRMRHKDGSDVWVLSRMYKAEFNADGTPSRVFGVNTDITEFKRIQNVLEVAQAEADSANRAKSEFLARMSHEIRTPMNAILGLSHLVLESELQAEQRSYIQHIDDAAQLLLNLINDILDFSKIEAGKLELDETDFNLDEVINRIANLLIYKAEEKNIWLVIDIEPDVPFCLHGDVTRLQQVLVNLLNNAIKFTSQGGVYFHISLNAAGHFVFTVKDSGIGIDEDGLRFLFKPFSQADGSVTRRYGGTGLGLAICKYLVEMMGGMIRVESVSGVGSQFTAEIPFAAGIHVEPVERNSQHAKIAVISDNPLVSQAAVNLFSRWVNGGDVKLYTGFRDFADAVTTAQDWLCLINDAAMSEIELVNGVELLQSRAPLINVKYFYLGKSGFEQRNREMYSESLQTVALIPKPLTPEKVQALLNPEPVRESQSGTPVVENQWQHHKLLLVEDNPVNQKVALGMLKKYGLHIDVVTDGQQAIDRLRQHGAHYYVLVLMDMEMPVLDGYAATRIIREDVRFTELPIVAMTAHAMKGDRDRCLAAGMNDYISKPIDAALLRDILAKYLKSSA